MSTLLPPPGEIAKMPVDWVEERSGLISFGRWMLFRNVPKDISWLQTLDRKSTRLNSSHRT